MKSIKGIQVLALMLLTTARLVKAQSCTFIAIVMDESGSMSGEQEFLRDAAMPQVIDDLRIRLNQLVFVCSYGYPAGSTYSGRVVGCSAGFDVADYAYLTGGGTEDGWSAIKAADAHAKNLTEIDGIQLSSCNGLSDNLSYFRPLFVHSVPQRPVCSYEL